MEIPGTDVEVDGRLINYENRPGGGDRMVIGIKWALCRNGSGADVTESCYPTFNDMMRLGESDTDSDMPRLVDVNKKGDGGRDSGADLSGDINVVNLQELVEMHAVLVEPDTQLAYPESWQETNNQPNMGTQPSPEWPTEEAYQPWPDRFRAGSGRANFMPDSQPLGEGNAEPTGRPVAHRDETRKQSDSSTDDEVEEKEREGESSSAE